MVEELQYLSIETSCSSKGKGKETQCPLPSIYVVALSEKEFVGTGVPRSYLGLSPSHFLPVDGTSPFQGLMVAILYCFVNNEVRPAERQWTW